MYIFGVVKSFSHKYRFVLLLLPVSHLSHFRNSLFKLVLYLTGAMLTIPFNIIIENAAVLVGMFGRKDQFYIVNKDIQMV